jgi:hypothetical protein
MRIIARRKRLSKNTVSQVILKIAEDAKGSIWIAKHFKPQWGRVLSVDGKVIRVFDPYAKEHPGSRAEKAWMLKKTWMAGVDVATKDLPHYQVIDGEVNPDLVTFFKRLKTRLGMNSQCSSAMEILRLSKAPEQSMVQALGFNSVSGM